MTSFSLVRGSAHRKIAHPVEPLLADRWSSRAMSGEPVSEAELMVLFEAARWAPSANNMQPWRFLYARRDTPHFSAYLDLLVESNRLWCERAGALLVLVSNHWNAERNSPIVSHSLDAGSAWQNLALQGWQSGLVIHGMGGFDRDKARATLQVPESYTVEMMIAVGKPGDPQQLPEHLRSREVPNDRRPLAQTVCEGKFSL